MKEQLQTIVEHSLQALNITSPVHIERTKDPKFGDFSCNAAMVLAKQINKKPRELAEQIVAHLPSSELVIDVSIAGPGFINFSLAPQAFQNVVNDILSQNENYGLCNVGQQQAIHLEIVSANPTGPLHVGHGRLAAYGATVANLLAAIGYKVHREYYVNDAGRQMHILAISVFYRYLQALQVEIALPPNAYQGDYIIDIATSLLQSEGDRFLVNTEQLQNGLPDDPEARLDAIIAIVQQLLGSDYDIIFQKAVTTILDDIKNDLHEFGVDYDEWFSEKSLHDSGAVQQGIAKLQEKGYLYEKDGALWFKATEFGDEKDRVVIRENGQPTYFAADIGYHLNKITRGNTAIYDILGADHHGYAARIRAFLEALGNDPSLLHVLLVQFAILYRGKQKVSMSTRGGQFVTLRELRDEVGKDAARFFYIMRKREQHLDFDLDLAKSQSNENPVYYIQYAHARICSVFRQLTHKHLSFDQQANHKQLHLLTDNHEKQLLRDLSRYPEVVLSAATLYEPHTLANYLQELANSFHTYYNASQFLVEDDKLREARLSLILATKIVLANGLNLLGVSAPQSM